MEADQCEFAPLLLPDGGIRDFPAAQAYGSYRLSADEDVPALAGYFSGLTECAQTAGKRPVFGLARSSLRVGWFRRHCPGVHLFVLRDHRRQFLSFLSQSAKGDSSCLERLMIVLGSNLDDPAFAPLRSLIVPAPPELDLSRRQDFFARQAHSAGPASLYTISYFLHRLAMADMSEQCDLILDVDRMAADAGAAREAERRVAELTGIEISFADCQPERYDDQLANGSALFDEFEARVEGLLPHPAAAEISPGLLARLEAMHRQAVEFHGKGMEAEAEEVYGGILELAPNHFAALAGLGLLRERQERLFEAESLIARAVAQRPAMVLVLAKHAQLLSRLNCFEAAIQRFGEAIALQPGDIALHNDIALALHSLGRWSEAEQHFRTALDIAPDKAELHNNMGATLRKLKRPDEAVHHHRRATELGPDNAEFWSNLAKATMELGRVGEVAHALEQAIAAAPTKAPYYRSLSEARRFTPGDRYLTAMQDMARSAGSLPESEQVELHFALAKALDDVGEYGEAFDHLRQGNALRRGAVVYDEAAVLGRLDRIRTAFTPELIKRLAGQGDPSAEPVFILGMPRSGSTLVEQILASHPAVMAAGELDTFDQTVAALAGARFPDAIGELTGDDLRHIGATYLDSVHREVKPGMNASVLRITDKMPNNFVYAGLIHLAFPRARIIHTRRDAVDTCLSCFSKYFVDSQPFSWDLGELGRYWRGYDALTRHWAEVLPADVFLNVDYHAVVDDLEGQARRLLDHCHLEWDPACLEFHRGARPVRTASWAQVRQPLYRNAVGRWHAYGDRLAPLLEALGISEDPAPTA
ncbi:MAG TPA: sulfotransferase [Patescibacteria group bacterium]|nr:sulfotransferase [Patescibacteria group bacterium]